MGDGGAGDGGAGDGAGMCFPYKPPNFRAISSGSDPNIAASSMIAS